MSLRPPLAHVGSIGFTVIRMKKLIIHSYDIFIMAGGQMIERSLCIFPNFPTCHVFDELNTRVEPNRITLLVITPVPDHFCYAKIGRPACRFFA